MKRSRSRRQQKLSNASQMAGELGAGVYRPLDQVAEDVFRSMLTIESAYRGARDVALLRMAARNLVGGCLQYLNTGPDQFRAEVQPLLPLTDLELDLLNSSGTMGDPAIADDLAARFGEWITRSPLLVDQRAVHVSDFLKRLRPSLSVWDDRLAAESMMDRALHPAWAKAPTE